MDVEAAKIHRIRYDRERSKLYVRFAGGDEYLYVGVPAEVHRSFVKAPSKGGFFAHEIRGRYPYNRLNS